MSSMASSPPAQPINESPTGHPETVPAGRLTWGSPARPAEQVSRITCRRWASSAAGGVSISGAIEGAVGSATTVPGLIRLRRWSRAAARTALAASACAGGDGRSDLHALGDAGAELRMLFFDEAAVHLPDLVGLDHAHRFAPLIEPAGREPHVLGLRQIALHPIECRAQKLDDRLVGFGEAVVGDQQGADIRAYGLAAEQHIADAAEHAGAVGEPSDGVERRRHVHAAFGVDAAVGGADTIEAAERGGDTHRAAGVRAEREVAGARRGGGGRAARRASRDAAGRPQVRRRAVVRVDASDAIEKFVADRLADDGRAGAEILSTAMAFDAAGLVLASQSGLPPPARSPAMSYMSFTAAVRPASGPPLAPLSGVFRLCGTKKPLMMMQSCAGCCENVSRGSKGVKSRPRWKAHGEAASLCQS